jgi:hypothetical protein
VFCRIFIGLAFLMMLQSIVEVALSVRSQLKDFIRNPTRLNIFINSSAIVSVSIVDKATASGYLVA